MTKWQTTSVGRIPVSWEYKKISDTDLYINDGNYSSKYPRQKELLSAGIPFISSKDLQNGRISYTNLRYISLEQHRTLLKGHIKEQDVLIVVRGNGVGDVALVDKRFENANINAQLAFIRSGDQHFGLFLYYLLLNYKQRKITETYVSGSAQPQITVRQLKSIFLAYPPLPEQRAIASVLSSLDAKFNLLHRQNETLEALAQTLFRQWFNEEPEADWEAGVIPDEFDFTMGLSPPGVSYNEEAIGIPMYQGKTDFTFRFPKRRVYTTDPKRFAYKFDTLISVRAPVGTQNMALEKCCIGRGVAAFRYRRNRKYSSYTYNKLNSIMSEIMVFEDSGTVFGSINKTDFETLEIIIPPKELIDKFENEVSPLDEKIYLNCKQIRTLEKLRDTLLPKLMNGELRVKGEDD